MSTPASRQLEELAATIISQMKQGADSWHMPWHEGFQEPINLITGKVFGGRNAAILWNAFNQRGYQKNEWATLHQWAQRRGKVRAGAKGVRVFAPIHHKVPGLFSGESNDLAGFRAYHVFNQDEINNFNPDHPDLFAEHQVGIGVDEHIETLVERSRADITYAGDRACYISSEDRIYMPPRSSFIATPHTSATEGFYATLVHELVHWTKRLGRSPRLSAFDDQKMAYAFEELIAELGAAMVCTRFGQKVEPRPDHAAYLSSWLAVLENDFRYFYRALFQAQEAVHWLYRSTGLVPDGWVLEPAANLDVTSTISAPPVLDLACGQESVVDENVWASPKQNDQPANIEVPVDQGAVEASQWHVEEIGTQGFVRTCKIAVVCGDCRTGYRLVLTRGEDRSACPSCYRMNLHPVQW